MVAFNTLDNGIFDLYEICMRTGFSHISFNQTVHCAAQRNVVYLFVGYVRSGLMKDV